MDHTYDSPSFARGELLDTLSIQVWVMTDERTYGYANVAHAAFLGKSREQIEQKDIADLLPPLNANICIANNREVYRTKKPVLSEEWALDAAGSRRLLRILKTPKLDASGRILYLSCTAEDITEQQFIAEQNKTREHVLDAIVRFSRELFSDSPDAIERGLRTLGQAVLVDRVYYWENHFDTDANIWLTSQKYEWCNEGVTAQIDNENLQNIPLDSFADFIGPLSKNQPYIAHVREIENADTKEILSSQQIQSILVLPVFVGGSFAGFVGFDSCTRERNWQEQEISLLQMFIELLGKSVSKSNLQREVEQTRVNFDNFFNTIDDLLCIFDSCGKFLHVNETLKRKTGYSESELVGQSISILHPPEQEDEVKATLERIIAGEEQTCHIPMQTKDGIRFPVETSVCKGVWNGEPAYFGVAQDMTLLEFSAEKFSKAFHDSLLLKVIVNIDDRTHIDVNEALCKALGYKREEIIGKTPFELKLFATQEDANVIIDAFKDKKAIQNEELTILDKAGNKHPVVMNASPIRIGTMTCVVVSMLDITERKQMERQLQVYNEHLEEMVQDKVHELSDALWGTVSSLVHLAESRDDITGGHLRRLSESCRIVSSMLSLNSVYSEQLSYEFILNIQQASLLHDIGKVGIRDSILLKPGKLTREEFDEMKKHTTIGAQTLQEAYPRYQNNSLFKMAIEIAYYHHERWDGKGYPKGLKGDQIPLAAQIVAICDVYDAMRSRRTYKPPFSHEETLAEIRRECGTHFNPIICDAFYRCTDEIRHLYDTFSL